MSVNKKIASFLVALLVLATVVIPAVIRIDHAVFEHEALTCDTGSNTHFHVPELDCDFHDFQLTPIHFFQGISTDITKIYINTTIAYGQYVANNDLHTTYFSLRGPPLYC